MIFQECPTCAHLYIIEEEEVGTTRKCVDCAQPFVVNTSVDNDDASTLTLLNVDDGTTMIVDNWRLRERGIPDHYVVVSGLHPDDWIRLIQRYIRQRDEARRRDL